MPMKLTSLKILTYLLTCIFVFYAVYFAIASIVFAIYSLEEFDGKIPFNFKNWIDLNDCCEKRKMVNTISLVVTFPVCGAIFGCYIPRWVWDFCVTVCVFHIILSCIVMLDFPKNWTWWVSVGVSCLLMIGSGEGVWHLLEWRRQKRIIVPEPIQQTNYMYR